MTAILDAVGTAVFYFLLPALLGGLLHELTHATVVVALGHRLVGMNLHRVFVGLRSGSTVIYKPMHDSQWNALIGLAPVVIGGLAALAWIVLGPPLVGQTGAALAVGWVFYTLNVSRADVMDGDIEPAPRLDKAIHAAFIGAVGLTLYFVQYGPARFIAYGLVLGALISASWNFFAWDGSPDLEPESGVGE